MNNKLTTDENNKGYQTLVNDIGQLYQTNRTRVCRAINTQLVETYWQIGQQIVEFEQEGKTKAQYGTALITRLSKDLKLRYGKGFSRSNVVRFRQFYIAYPIGATMSHQLSWSHWVELLKIENEQERLFVQKYQLYLPNVAELRREIEITLQEREE